LEIASTPGIRLAPPPWAETDSLSLEFQQTLAPVIFGGINVTAEQHQAIVPPLELTVSLEQQATPADIRNSASEAPALLHALNV